MKNVGIFGRKEVIMTWDRKLKVQRIWLSYPHGISEILRTCIQKLRQRQ